MKLTDKEQVAADKVVEALQGLPRAQQQSIISGAIRDVRAAGTDMEAAAHDIGRRTGFGEAMNKFTFTDKVTGEIVSMIDPATGRVNEDSVQRVLSRMTEEDRAEMMRQFDVEMERIKRQKAEADEEFSASSDQLEAIRGFKNAIEEWELRGLRLERPGGSGAHRLIEAMKAGRVRAYLEDFAQDLKNLGLQKAMPFVIEHDWASAFAGAGDFDEGDYKLPYDAVLFEFRVSGFHVCVFATDAFRCFLIECKGNWLVSAMNETVGFGEKLPAFLNKQIRAICIALDAEVAMTETVRAPERLNRSRLRKGSSPLLNYHVVRLAARRRAAPLPNDHESTEGHRKRMHFVRGHWRHYETHKTWIKWHLRGDPDLGFIDKHYRL